MGKLNVEICAESGICTIVKEDGTKVDLMPEEADSLRHAAGQAESIRKILAEVDAGFADNLDEDEIQQLSTDLR